MRSTPRLPRGIAYSHFAAAHAEPYCSQVTATVTGAFDDCGTGFHHLTTYETSAAHLPVFAAGMGRIKYELAEQYSVEILSATAVLTCMRHSNAALTSPIQPERWITCAYLSSRPAARRQVLDHVVCGFVRQTLALSCKPVQVNSQRGDGPMERPDASPAQRALTALAGSDPLMPLAADVTTSDLPSMSSETTGARSVPLRRRLFVAEIVCLLCGRETGTAAAERWPPTGPILFQPSHQHSGPPCFRPEASAGVGLPSARAISRRLRCTSVRRPSGSSTTSKRPTSSRMRLASSLACATDPMSALP